MPGSFLPSADGITLLCRELERREPVNDSLKLSLILTLRQLGQVIFDRLKRFASRSELKCAGGRLIYKRRTLQYLN